MRRIQATLVAEGSSDRLLIPLIELIFRDNADDLPYKIVYAENLPPPSAGLKARIASALELYPCDLLFVHRDADSSSSTVRVKEIKDNWPSHLSTGLLTCVVPIHMTEAWLLTSEIPIRAAVGNPNGTDPLGLPATKDIEGKADPKALLFAALKAASGLSPSRKRKFKPEQFRHRVSELTDDLTQLRKLGSFKHLETQVRRFLSLRAQLNSGSTP